MYDGSAAHNMMKLCYALKHRWSLFILLITLCLHWPHIVGAKETSTHTSKHSVPAESQRLPGGKDEDCKPVEPCQMCLSSKRFDEECKSTGKIQKFECTAVDDENDEVTVLFRSCKRTVADEEFLMVQMQVFCFLMGSLAVLSVRKQKMISLSLFDQRRLPSSKRRSSETGPLMLELAVKQQQDETASLTQSSIDVV